VWENDVVNRCVKWSRMFPKGNSNILMVVVRGRLFLDKQE
jgi:hypothetical protein